MVEYSPVVEKHDRIAIVASGPSAREFKTPPGVTVIAVNGAGIWVDRVHYWFTLDPSPRNMHIMRSPRRGIKYFAAVPKDFGTPEARIRSMRDKPPKHVHYLQRIPGSGFLKSCHGLSNDPLKIHTGNSAYGALGLAYLMGAKKIAIFGVDADRARRVDGGKPGPLHHLPELFESTAEQLKAAGGDVVFGSPKSLVDCFPRMTVKDACEWLTS